MPPPRQHVFTPGQRVGRLTVIREVSGGRRRRIECECDCGTPTTVLVDALVAGETKSCGCLLHEGPGRPPVHGLSQHPLFDTWSNMMQRCSAPTRRDYKYYGGRGITVCESWKDPRQFIAWIEANLGPRPEGMTLDRVNVNGNYEPGNVRWATWSQQRHNQRKRAK